VIAGDWQPTARWNYSAQKSSDWHFTGQLVTSGQCGDFKGEVDVSLDVLWSDFKGSSHICGFLGLTEGFDVDEPVLNLC